MITSFDPQTGWLTVTCSREEYVCIQMANRPDASDQGKKGYDLLETIQHAKVREAAKGYQVRVRVKVEEDNVMIEVRTQEPANHQPVNPVLRITDQRLTAAIKTLEGNGYTYHGGEYWKPPVGPPVNALLDTIDSLRKQLATQTVKPITSDTPIKMLRLVVQVSDTPNNRAILRATRARLMPMDAFDGAHAICKLEHTNVVALDSKPQPEPALEPTAP